MQGTDNIRKRLQPSRYFLAAIALALLAMLSIMLGRAQAARVHPLFVTEVVPNQEFPRTIAVDGITHHFYVVGATGGGRSVVYNFEEDGQLDPLHPELIVPPSLKPFGVAVDDSGGVHTGYIYVADRFNTVRQFDPEGKATAVTITAATIPANGTAQEIGLPPVVNNGSFEPRTMAVSESGNVFVTDTSAPAIDEFTPAGVFVKQVGAGVIGGFLAGIAVDGNVIYLALNGSEGALSAGLSELDAATGQCVQVGCAPIETGPIGGVAVDRAAGTVFTTAPINGELEGKVSEYEAATGELLGVTHPKALHSPQGIAVDETSGNIIVGDIRPFNEGTVKIFGPEQTVPEVTTLTPETVTDRSAILKGEIGAAGLTGVTCVFQYVTQEEFGAHGFEGTPSEPASTAPCKPAGPFSGAAMNVVQADLSGLRGGTTYHERILGESTPGEPEKGSNPGEDITFTTEGPTVNGTEPVGITAEAATLKGTVDPNDSATSYRFQYLTQVQFEAGGWSGATEVPSGGASLGSGSAAVPVSEAISELLPGTTYRFRILAVSADGTTEGQEVEFTAQQLPFGGLPDDRAYEQVSPTAKNGANLQGAINSVQAALDGERITFLSEAGIPGGEGAQQFPTFMASRSPGGWSTQGLLPPASYGPRAVVLGWNEDLGDTYDFATQAFKEGELLRRRSSDGSLTRAGTIASPNNPLAYAGSSQGGAVALLESDKGGLKDAAGPIGDLEGKQNVYAYDQGTGRLVVAGVMNDGSVPPEGAMAGPYDWFNFKSTTALAGTLGGYYTQPTHAISADGSEVFFTAAGTGWLYVRLNPLASQSAMSGEVCTEAVKACTVRVSAPAAGVGDPGTPAAFLDASADGRLVYFLDEGKLTTTATRGSGYDLYRYDIATGALTDLTPDTTDRGGARVEGMLGVGGPTGEDAYFVASGQLAAGTTLAPSGETNLYALHGTAIEFLTRLGTSGEGGGEQLDWIPASRLANGDPAAHAARVSADGQTLLFGSTRQLTAYNNRGNTELYLFRTGLGISCVSCNPSGEAPTGFAGVQLIPQLEFSHGRTYSIMTRNLSADGRRVFFDSPDRLVSADHNDVNDVYEWEADGEGSCASDTQDGGCLFLISGGAAGADASWFGDADEKGENVFFFTAQPLVAQDKDELVDVYDARVGGGIAAQETTQLALCEGTEGCRGAAPAPPALFSAPATFVFQGPGNPPPPPAGKPVPKPAPKPVARCRKGRVRVHGKCVVRRAKQKRHGTTKGRKKRVQKRGKGARR